MIVRNETKNIIKTLNAAKPVIDFISILDTGSTDDTLDIVKKWGLDNHVPTTVHSHTFTNFGEMRTLAFELSVATYPATYQLCIDARQIVTGTINKKKLTTDGYYIVQEFMSLQYPNMRLLRSDKKWRCRGVVHEYWEVPAGSTTDTLKGVTLRDNGNGGNRTSKIERYRDLLTEGLRTEEDPYLRSRYKFYLANSLYDLGQIEESIPQYESRLEDKGWTEEQWYCAYRIGSAYMHLNNPEKGVYWYLKAFNIDPFRAESLCALATHYRIAGMHSTAMLFALMAIRRQLPARTLFVEEDAYMYRLDYEISISGYYVDKEKGRESLKYLLSLGKKLPEPYYTSTRNNKKFYS